MNTLRLPALAIICGLALSVAFTSLRPVIETNRENFEADRLLDVIGTRADSIDEILPSIYAVRRVDAHDSYIFEVVTKEGYNGRIALWMAVDETGLITGVRVKSHHETPGLGDKIETAVSDWIYSFNGYSTATPANAFEVKRHGGDFDQFSGATITPRAVIHAVRDGLETFESERERWQQERADEQ